MIEAATFAHRSETSTQSRDGLKTLASRAVLTGGTDLVPAGNPYENSFDLGSIEYDCECATCLVFPSYSTPCVFSVTCFDGMGGSTTTQVVPEGVVVGYRKKVQTATVYPDIGGEEEEPDPQLTDCLIYQVCDNNIPCNPGALRIKTILESNCEEPIPVLLDGEEYFLSEIEFFPVCLVGDEIDPPALGETGGAGNRPLGNFFNAIVFPNPATETLNIQIFSPVPTLANLQLYDMMGRKLFERTVEVAAGKYIEQWDVLNTFVPGVYRLSIQDDRGNTSVHSVVLTKK